MQEQLVELDARLAFDDRDDTLVVLHRREPRDLHLVDVAHEDAALLRLGDEIVHGAGAKAALLGDVEPSYVAPRADRFEDRVRTGDGLAGWSMGRRRGARARGDPPDRLRVALLPAARAPPTAGSARCRTAAQPRLATALALRLTPLIRTKLAGLLAVFAWELLLGPELLATEGRALRAELRSGRAELGSLPGESAATATAPPPASAPAVRIEVAASAGGLRRRGRRATLVRRLWRLVRRLGLAFGALRLVHGHAPSGRRAPSASHLLCPSPGCHDARAARHAAGRSSRSRRRAARPRARARGVVPLR